MWVLPGVELLRWKHLDEMLHLKVCSNKQHLADEKWAVACPEQLVNTAWLINKISVERVVKVNHMCVCVCVCVYVYVCVYMRVCVYIYIYIAVIK
jgi:hypothetical protein